jgi:hypothetical protein
MRLQKDKWYIYTGHATALKNKKFKCVRTNSISAYFYLGPTYRYCWFPINGTNEDGDKIYWKEVKASKLKISYWK